MNEFPTEWQADGEIVKGFFSRRALRGRWKYWYFLGHALYDTVDPVVRMLPWVSQVDDAITAGDTDLHETRFAHDSTLSRESRTTDGSKFDLEALMSTTKVASSWRSYTLCCFIFKIFEVALTTFFTSYTKAVIGILAVCHVFLTGLVFKYPTYQHPALCTLQRSFQLGHTALACTAFCTTVLSDNEGRNAGMSIGAAAGTIMVCAAGLAISQWWWGSPGTPAADDELIASSPGATAPLHCLEHSKDGPGSRDEKKQRSRSSSRSKNRTKAAPAVTSQEGRTEPAAVKPPSPQISLRQVEPAAPPPAPQTQPDHVALSYVGPTSPPMTAVPLIQSTEIPPTQVNVTPPSQEVRRPTGSAPVPVSATDQ